MLKIHRAERADGLVEALADLLADPLDDPMTPEVIAVPTRGVERWVTQRLSAHLGTAPGASDGVCANVDFPFPARLVGGAAAAASGIDRETDPWLPQRLVWPLLDIVDNCIHEPWLITLATHIGASGADPDGERRARRFPTVRHVADLFDRYAVHRPEMLSAWADGENSDGTGQPLPDTVTWQAELWRRLRGGLGIPSPAERLAGACERLRQEAGVVDLPARLCLFGLTRLPVSYLRVLAALGAQRDVHLFVLHPSPKLWAEVAAAIQGRPPVVRRAEDVTATLAVNPLLASWGQDAREMQLSLASGGGPLADDHRPVGEPGSTLLARIQADIRADRAPPRRPLPGQPDPRPILDPGDESLRIHACHGPDRQVEVIRDAILHLLEGDPTLEPRDIIVMCPDIETFAPLIHATFDAGSVNDADPDAGPAETPGAPATPDLRVRLADRSLRQTNPVLAVVSDLLVLAAARLSAPQVLDLAARDPVRRRFGFDDEDLARIEKWIGDTGIRWGLDAGHRAAYGLGWLDANTWRAGLDRILTGVAAAEEDQRLVGGVLPLDDLPSGDIDLAGRFAEFVDRLACAVSALAGPQPVGEWVGAIAQAADALTTTGGRLTWQRMQLQRILDDVLHEAGDEAHQNLAPLSLAEVRALLADRLRGRPTRANFRTGHLTVCTLMPMRSVPHRVVCLLGLDDGVFPRKTGADGDDIILNDPHVGDRDARAEDRQLLLDALLAATDALVITYAGHDERTNAVLQPAVVVGELLDVVDRTVRLAETPGQARPATARHCVVIHHPLQPFDPRNFTPGAVEPQRSWSFDEVSLEGARALSGQRRPKPPFLAAPLPKLFGGPVALHDLIAFVEHPVKAFLRQRLGLSMWEDDDKVSESLPVELGGLQEWAVGERLIEGLLRGDSLSACLTTERARGTLPPGEMGSSILSRIAPAVEELVLKASGRVRPWGDRGSVEVNVRLPGGRLLVGTVPGVTGDLLWSVTYSALKPKHRLAAWVRHLAVTAAYPDRPFRSATIGRGIWGPIAVAELAVFPGRPAERQARALSQLAVLLDLYDRGMREPLPLYCATSAAYASGAPDPKAAALKAWKTPWDQFDHEDRDPAHVLVLGGVRAFGDLLVAAPCEGEDGDGWAGGEASRFGRYARRLWAGLLTSETVSTR